MKRLLTALLLSLTLPALALAAPDMPKLVQLIDYIGVDYRDAVADGEIINAAEYGEMRDFASAVVEQTGQLPPLPARDGLQAAASNLKQLIERRESPDAVAAAASELRHTMISTFNIVVAPRKAPDLERGRQLFADNCAACHGINGQGDGIDGRGMEPAPTDFTDAGRYSQRTLYGLYSTISAGVTDTGMRAFDELSEDDRWTLAFLVGAMAVDPQAAAAGKAVWAAGSEANELGQITRFTITTPNEARNAFGHAGGDLMAFLRTQPEVMFANASPLDFARETLAASVDAYRAGQKQEAYKLAVAAYLEGFELVEHGLDAVDGKLRTTIESEMTAYRVRVRGDSDVSAVEQHAGEITSLLNLAAERLSSSSLSTTAAFAAAFIILLREGLEALLVVAALGAFLIKTDRRDAMPYLHFGWIGALILGLFTWLASVYLIDFSCASREITEGVAALIAMAVLFYVGFWLHSKTSAVQWQRFIDGSMKKALSAGTLWGLTGLSFIAVYREVFETILFYQALWAQANAAAQASLLGGIGAGAAALAILGWLILRYSTRLPLRQFFSVTSICMYGLAVVFAGKGSAALQEAGKLPVHPVSFPRVDLLGIYPNMQGLLVQAGLVVLALIIFWGTRLRRREVAA